MSTTYSTAKICPFDNQDCDLVDEGLTLEPGIEDIMSSSTNYEELEYAWKAWRDESGAKIKEYYADYIELSNQVAAANGFEDMGQMWRDRYETEDFIQTLNNLWGQVQPLYDELHTYVMGKLEEKYVGKVNMSDGLIPANILGNMWAQSWVNLEPFVRPFPEASAVDVTQAMIENAQIDVLWMFGKSNDFYTSMALDDCAESYGDDSMIEQPDGKQVLCHASAWDFCDGTYRIKMCTQVNMEDFITVHHEMGHIQYYHLYKDQPITFRGGANPGFHEAVGHTIALSVATPSYLQRLGLLSEYEDSEEASINALMNMALERVAFLPFGLLIDKWRWDVFSTNAPENEWNDRWWEYRKQYQKVKPPVERGPDDFDPGAKYHVAGDSQYINSFVAHILQFQLYRGLCITAGEYAQDDPESQPLHKCDFHGNETAGQNLRDGLALGSSKPWPEALNLITGETELDASAILEYFKPLYDYLYRYNRNLLTEQELRNFLKEKYNPEVQELYTAEVHADWNYATDVTEENANILNAAILSTAAFERNHWETVFRHQDEGSIEDEGLRRQLQFLKVLGNAALDDEKLTELNCAISAMTEVYSTAAICPYDDQDCETPSLKLDPGIESIMSSSTDYDELLYAWTTWRNVSGAEMRENFKTYVDLSNEAARANGFSDKGDMWLSRFESATLVEDLDKLWEEVEPLYKELHLYVSTKLKTRYGEDLDLSDNLIPAHVLGNMWTQSWINLASLVTPFPDVDPIDVTKALEDHGYTVGNMFDIANNFYTSLGLVNANMSYGDDAMIERPADREVVCHASAWDFYDRETFRVKMCTEVDYEDFITIHHELGHIQYFLLYKNQPITLRTGANPGFHEAVGDTIALSVATPQHLQKIDLLENYEESEEADINALMNMALERVAFLPFGLLIDKWRWDVFSGTVSEDEWNQHWWHYRETIQGVKSPTGVRNEEYFDPGAKFHVAADYQYISYFVAHILEFQFYKALCIEAGEYDPDTKDPPLHKCDYFGSPEAGEKLREALSLGASKPWEDVLEELTGERKMDASALNEYFKPLFEYLQEENRKEDDLETLINIDFDKESRSTLGAQANADWDFETDIDDDDSAAAQVQAALDAAAFRRNWYEKIEHVDDDSYTDDIQRQLKNLRVLGDAALDDDKLSELRSAINAMRKSYGSARICPFSQQDCQDAQKINEEGVKTALASSTDYEEMLYLWEEWRAIGVDVKQHFKTYVGLANEAAQANGYGDRGDQWRTAFGTSVQAVENLWKDVEPLYAELHTLVGNILKEDLEWEDSIPAHALGSIWSDSWYNFASLVRPYPDAGWIDVNGIFGTKTVTEIFSQTNRFYLSLSLKDTSEVYRTGGNSIIQRPTEPRDYICQPSAWNFHDGEDYRVKICSTLDRESYVAVHRVLSHIQYFLQYEDQVATFRSAANPALYDAIGGAFALSAVAPQHFTALELVEEIDETDEAYFNLLMDVALERLAALPFALALDRWRWDVFNGDVNEDTWNDLWWEYREIYQNISQPANTTSNEGFDLGVRFQVIADEEIGSYFALGILEFQIYRALCIKAGKYDPETKDPPLYQCDFYGSTEVGTLLTEALSAGNSKDWPEVLEIITGETSPNPTAVLEYFEPLYEYMKEKNFAISHKFSVMLYLCSFFVVYYIPKLLW